MKDFLISKYIFMNLAFDNMKERSQKRVKGLGTVEVILITFVLVSLVIIFKESLTGIVRKYTSKIDPKWN